jgi:hypothetical protein
MKKILFIVLVLAAVLTSGCYQPNANINTTVQQGGATPTAARLLWILKTSHLVL